MRCTRAMAWSSTAVSKHGSNKTTVEAHVSVKPADCEWSSVSRQIPMPVSLIKAPIAAGRVSTGSSAGATHARPAVLRAR